MWECFLFFLFFFASARGKSPFHIAEDSRETCEVACASDGRAVEVDMGGVSGVCSVGWEFEFRVWWECVLEGMYGDGDEWEYVMTRCKRGRPRMSVVVPLNCVNTHKKCPSRKKRKEKNPSRGEKKEPIKKSAPVNSVCKRTYLHTRSRDNVNIFLCMCTCASRYTRTTSHTSHA